MEEPLDTTVDLDQPRKQHGHRRLNDRASSKDAAIQEAEELIDAISDNDVTHEFDFEVTNGNCSSPRDSYNDVLIEENAETDGDVTLPPDDDDNDDDDDKNESENEKHSSQNTTKDELNRSLYQTDSDEEIKDSRTSSRHSSSRTSFSQDSDVENSKQTPTRIIVDKDNDNNTNNNNDEGTENNDNNQTENIDNSMIPHEDYTTWAEMHDESTSLNLRLMELRRQTEELSAKHEEIRNKKEKLWASFNNGTKYDPNEPSIEKKTTKKISTKEYHDRKGNVQIGSFRRILSRNELVDKD